ncbi:T9SS type A sorting domain-containing protein [Fulvivirga ligni]|uniref:T9SS type A sorting domain-containing protein n=1 Tax=Fulvivirga ligni TaxID=2904246 RepID=UPI001F39445C|nr:T9SS type A sorting domain-containing protein [Fulvivirga ligni]UII18979.1 T9SS type A sorting domain-containing protein [Fulvivirga ligni]
MNSKNKLYINTLFTLFFLFVSSVLLAQPNWPAIKSNALFNVYDTNYYAPEIQPVNVGGWEDGLYMTRDGKHMFSTYLPIDLFSWVGDFDPCIDFDPYYRGPLLGIDTVTNPYGCGNYIHSDIIMSNRTDTSVPFTHWQPTNLIHSYTFDGGACGVLLNSDTFDVFIFTSDLGEGNGVDLMFSRNVHWWMYFCANNAGGLHSIYKSRQMIPGDWDSWGAKELVIEPADLIGTDGFIYGVGEPTLTEWGDISFVAIYGNHLLADTTDVFDCDPWILKRKTPVITSVNYLNTEKQDIAIYPNPVETILNIEIPDDLVGGEIHIYDMLGNQTGAYLKCTNIKMKVDVMDLPHGTYFLRFQKQNTVLVEKLIVESE